MKPVLAWLMLFFFFAAAGLGQNPANASAKTSALAVVEGLVTKDPGGEPVKKAVIELIAENQSEGRNYTAVTAADGSFQIENVAPAGYRLFVERTGFLEVDKHGARTEGRVLALSAGQELKDLHIRLQAAAVVQGRVTDEDGEPLPNAQVTVQRQTFVSGRRGWEQAGAERTNDLGEYRVAALAAGNYYVSVSPPPDFKSLIEATGAAAAEPHNGSVPDKRAATTYQTTYYPGTADRGQATPIQLHAGDDFPVNFSLTPSPSLSIRGSVANLPPKSSAVVMLQSRDFNLMLNGAEMHGDGSFVIRDVAPGAYTILATVENASVPMMARQGLQVNSNSVDGLRLAPQPGGSVRGRLRMESKGTVHFDPSQIFLLLASVDGDDEPVASFTGEFSSLAHLAADGSFEWKNVPPGNYYVQLGGSAGSDNADSYLKSALAGGRDVGDTGLAVNGGTAMLDLVASASGASVEGVVMDRKGVPVANAIVVAAPEMRLRARIDRYRKTVADQSGRFTLHGAPPGDYTVFAWESVDGEAYYNPEFLKAFEARGSALHLAEGERKRLQLQVIPEPEDQP